MPNEAFRYAATTSRAALRAALDLPPVLIRSSMVSRDKEGYGVKYELNRVDPMKGLLFDPPWEAQSGSLGWSHNVEPEPPCQNPGPQPSGPVGGLEVGVATGAKVGARVGTSVGVSEGV